LFLSQLVTTESYIGPAWSLSLEVWMYALTPFLVTLRQRTMYALIGTSLTTFVVYTCLRTLIDAPYFAGVGYGANLLLLSFPWLLGFMLGTQANKKPIFVVVVAP
jgi:peptidoglycan/LPS O-acetylase OafA/YrhL